MNQNTYHNNPPLTDHSSPITTSLSPLISIVVTTKNEEKHIKNCLVSIKAQTYEHIEIIVVDNDSDDRTKEIACKYTDQVYDKGPERSAQRNYGMIEIAKGEYVMFVDADMILSPVLIENCVKYMKNSDDLALHISEIILGSSYFSRVRRFERSFYDGTVIDGARFFQKESFVRVGGFDESMSGPEDWDIDKKIKEIGKIGLLKGALNRIDKDWEQKEFVSQRGVNPLKYSNVTFHNESQFSLKQYLEKKGYYAKSFDTYIEKWGRDDSDIIKQLGLFYRFFCVFIEHGKWKKNIANLHLTFGMLLLRILVGIKFLFIKIFLNPWHGF